LPSFDAVFARSTTLDIAGRPLTKIPDGGAELLAATGLGADAGLRDREQVEAFVATAETLR
jgi:hypothetical protein